MMRRWDPAVSARRQRGFTLVELMVVVAVIAILAAIALPLFGSMSAEARIAKARADLRAIASAISMYYAHAGALPATLAELTSAVTNAQGASAGPFLGAVPVPPPGGSPMWTAYEAGYSRTGEGEFSISASGDGISVTVP
jgi:prepilin-type N-terminal cleavage/methylation domain-containing protein